MAPGAVLNSRSLGVNDNGTLFGQIGAVNYQGPTTGYFSTIGNNVRQPVTYQEFIVNPMERKSFFGKFDYDVTENVEAYGQFLYNRTTATGQVGWTPTLFVVPTVPVTNPFIPADLRTILASRPNPTADFTINQRFMGLDPREFPSDFTVGQYIFGLRGDLPFKDWSWDIYGSYDSTDLVETQDKAILKSRMRNLLYAADGGASICAGGFNPFGFANSTSISPACRRISRSRDARLHAADADDLRSQHQGLVVRAAGRRPEVRVDPGHAREQVRVRSGSRRARTWTSSARCRRSRPRARRRVEGSGDRVAGAAAAGQAVRAPLEIECRLPQRPTTMFSGRVETYKADGIVGAVQRLLVPRRLRARDPRAEHRRAVQPARRAGADRLAAGSGRSVRRPFDRRGRARTARRCAHLCVATGVPAPIADTYQYTTVAIGVINSGNPDLTPEEADTITFGVVFRREFDAPLFSDLSLSVDYYDIDITDVIGTGRAAARRSASATTSTAAIRRYDAGQSLLPDHPA